MFETKTDTTIYLQCVHLHKTKLNSRSNVVSAKNLD